MDNEQIRQFQRQTVALRGILRVAESDREQVQFSNSMVSSNDDYSINLTVVDVGFGGVGVESEAFLPRNMRGILEVMRPDPEDGDSTSTDVLLTHEVTAKRCTQISREPAYQVGLAFGSVTSDLKHIVECFLADRASDEDSKTERPVAEPDRPGIGDHDHA